MYFPFFIALRVAAGGGVGECDVDEFSLFSTVGLDGAEFGSFLLFLCVSDFEGLPLGFLSSSVAGEGLGFVTFAR